MMPNDMSHQQFDHWYNDNDINVTWPWAGNLPPAVQQYVSPRALWTRLVGDTNSTTLSPTDKIATQLLPAMQGHWQVYEEQVCREQQQDQQATSSETSWLRPYLEYRLAQDPARPMLQALYGKEWTEDILQSVLFPLDLIFGNDSNDSIDKDSK